VERARQQLDCTAFGGELFPEVGAWEGMAVMDDVLLVLALLAGAAAAVLLRTAYVVTKDPTTRRMLAGWGWPLAALAIVLGVVFLAVEQV
jgi:hypothetical protein